MWRSCLLIAMALCLFASPAQAENRYASIIVDANSQDVLHARQIDAPRYPASLTKVMTLYLVFDALEAGALSLDEKLTVSRAAARTPPVELGLRTGQKISVHELIQSVAVRSHNDSAVVLAERLAGSEARFAQMMTAKARELNMHRTTFKTANGLPHPEQLTTARDMAKLAHAHLTHHRKYFHYFGQQSFRGQRNTNALLREMAHVDGFKTGYTRASGYNLMVSAMQNGRRQIVVVLGGASGQSRNAHVRDLVERGFKVMDIQPPPINVIATPAPIRRDSPARIVALRGQDGARLRVQTVGAPIALPTASKWAVVLRNLPSERAAFETAIALRPGATPEMSSGFANSRPVFHAKLYGLTAQEAKSTCKTAQTTCWLIAP